MKKILVTLGPASLNEATIRKMTKLGVTLFRINLSHTNLDDIERSISIIHKSTEVPVCLDSEGAQIRNQCMKNRSEYFELGSTIKIHYDEVLGDVENISFAPFGVASKFVVNDILRIDFNMATIQVIEKHKTYCLSRVITPGRVGSNKAVDVNRDIHLEPITEKDLVAVRIGREMGVKNFALSFANTPEDVILFRSKIGTDGTIISKIESRSGLMYLEKIASETDELLIDRGDLSRQVIIEKIPFLQRRIIAFARIKGKPIHVATNLLESMIKNQVPTRAEVNDVVSTILMGADGLVLAAETAIGEYPVHSVEIIRNILLLCEKWTTNTNISEILDM